MTWNFLLSGKDSDLVASYLFFEKNLIIDYYPDIIPRCHMFQKIDCNIYIFKDETIKLDLTGLSIEDALVFFKFYLLQAHTVLNYFFLTHSINGS